MVRVVVETLERMACACPVLFTDVLVCRECAAVIDEEYGVA